MKTNLQQKIIIGFFTMILLTLILGGIAYYGSKHNEDAIITIGNEHMPIVEALLSAQKDSAEITAAQRTLLNTGLDLEMRQAQYDSIHKHMKSAQKHVILAKSLPHDEQQQKKWHNFSTIWKNWEASTEHFLELAGQFDALKLNDPVKLERDLSLFEGMHYTLQLKLIKAIENQTTFEGGDNHKGCGFGKWLAQQKIENPEVIQKLKTIYVTHERFHESVKQIKAAIESGNSTQAEAIYTQETLPSAEATFAHFEEIQNTIAKVSGNYERMKSFTFGEALAAQEAASKALEDLVSLNIAEAKAEVAKAKDFSNKFNSGLMATNVIALVLGILLNIVISTVITKSVKKIASKLMEGAQQTTASANQVSSASQQMAEGASEQAAGLEETSSSLEEFSSMTKLNATHSAEANEIMTQTSKVVAEANDSMKKLATSMEDIANASDETQKIIRNIDEIAFQTNLLALNAAVEAARAGEAGAGFAVVADEVRSLAMRAGDAAKNTSELIESSVDKIRAGVELVGKTSTQFDQVSKGANNSTTLIASIAASSEEQATGIEQINNAVAEMDKVTQDNASSAEEIAASAEELNTQASILRDAVGELQKLAGAKSETLSFNKN